MTESGLFPAVWIKEKRNTIRILLLSLLPFMLFIGGYYTAALWWGNQSITVPGLLGLPSHKAIELLSQRHLYPHVMAQQENAHLDEGTVVEQIPPHGQSVKPNQTIFIVTSHKPACKKTPQCVGLSVEQARARCEADQVQIREHQLPSIYPPGQVIAQIPAYGEPLERNHVIVYVAQRMVQWRIMPSCIGYDVTDIVNFCHEHQIPVHIFTRSGARLPDSVIANQYYVYHQKPIPGTFIDTQKPPLLQVVVSDQ